MASRIQWNDGQATGSAENRPHVPCPLTLVGSSTVGPIGDSHCIEEALECLISGTSVQFSPAITGQLFAPFPTQCTDVTDVASRPRVHIGKLRPVNQPDMPPHLRSFSRTWSPPRNYIYGMVPSRIPPSPVCWPIQGR